MGIRATAKVAIGSPAWVIGQFARYAEADIVVVATHQRSGLSRLMLGSVATSVLQQGGHRPAAAAGCHAAGRRLAGQSRSGLNADQDAGLPEPVTTR